MRKQKEQRRAEGEHQPSFLPERPFEGQVLIDRDGNRLTFLSGSWHTDPVAVYMQLSREDQDLIYPVDGPNPATYEAAMERKRALLAGEIKPFRPPGYPDLAKMTENLAAAMGARVPPLRDWEKSHPEGCQCRYCRVWDGAA